MEIHSVAIIATKTTETWLPPLHFLRLACQLAVHQTALQVGKGDR
jgi:hypothetical protein